MALLLFAVVPINLNAADRQVIYPSCNILIKDLKSVEKQKTEFRIVAVDVNSERTAISCELTVLKKETSEDFTGFQTVPLLEGATSLKEQESGLRPYEDIIEPARFSGQNVNILHTWVNRRLVCPESMKLEGKQGQVLVGITVNMNGKAKYAILKSTHPEFSHAVMDALKDSQMWTPATVYGKPVTCAFTFPVIFKLNDRTPRQFLRTTPR